MLSFYSGRLFCTVFLLFSIPSLVMSVLDPMQHDVHLLNPQIFDSTITKFRSNSVSAVFFYSKKNSDDVSALLTWYNDAAKSLKGIVRISAISCDEHEKFCSKENRKDSIYIYPPLPLPAIKFEGEKSAQELKRHVLYYIPRDKVTQVGSVANKEEKIVSIDNFLSEHLSVPKVLIFTKKGPNHVIYALSNAFDKKLKFCYALESDGDLVKRYKISSFPKVLLLKAEAKKPEIYNGEINFHSMFEWMNIYAETFVMGGGFSDDGSVDDGPKPWLVQKIPEMHNLSYHDICGKYKTYCVIYLRLGDLTADEQNMLEELHQHFTPHINDRGTDFKWMWMNLEIEAEFKKLFMKENSIVFPSAVVLGTNKRLKYFLMPLSIDGEPQVANEDTIKSMVDKLLGGDARFSQIPGQKLPKWAVRENSDKKDEL